MTDPSLTVLMTVYHGTTAPHVRQALDSLYAQTRPAEEILLVQDGPVGEDVAEILAEAEATRDEVRVLRRENNEGNAVASAAAMATLRTEFYARQDSDDISYPERFERQLAFLAEHPGVDLVGSAMTEFVDFPEQPTGVRALPESPAEINRYLTINNPINHPTVMARVEAIRAVGGYQPVHLMEDYDLMARLVADGKVLANMTEELVYFRVGDAQLSRRTGLDMIHAELTMQRHLVDYGLVTAFRAVGNFLLRSTYRLLPKQLLTRVYRVLFHRRIHAER
ncbi:glycosyltransferase [Corynebacterium ciconiae]|uniref:glycosyltransferase n=1 Tax=Corynebacterium ciconiae TaxID=227319 RepID=UPI000367C0B9|nr:glycosyltransferase [Corynebacterium ciconiae]